MIKLEIKEGVKSTKTKTTSTKTYYFYLMGGNRRKRNVATVSVKEVNKRSWIRREASEVGSAIIEATLNNIWHTPVWVFISTLIPLYLHYFIVLTPWLSPAALAGSAAFVTYIIAAVLLSYLRRFSFWVVGKIRHLFREK